MVLSIVAFTVILLVPGIGSVRGEKDSGGLFKFTLLPR